MLKLGILKFSGSKSLSKPMHLAALNILGIEGEYSIYECSPENLNKQFQELKEAGVRGVNVTIPHKIPLMKLVDNLTERAKLVGAVNTVVFDSNGKTIGENTDLPGFFNAIPEEYRKDIKGKDVALLGCGGAACACAIAFIQSDVKTLKIFARDINKLKHFKDELEEKKAVLKSNTNIEIALLSEITLKDIFILTNTTPVGMAPNIDTPINKNALKDLRKDALVYDIIYNPFETTLLKDAKSLGFKTLNGVEMLVLQGAESLKLWTNKNNVPVDIMREAVLKELTN